jgi:hypothetical protein
MFIVFSRTSEADYVIGKVKMKNILVINKLDRSNAGIRHIAMEDNKTEYESYMFYQRKFLINVKYSLLTVHFENYQDLLYS